MDQLRHEHILGRLSANRKVLAADLATELSVSVETIRRDLIALERHALLRRIHGGAVPALAHQDRPIIERSRIAFREKTLIARLALGRLRPGMSLFLDTGTTTLALARELGSLAGLSVYTNSLDIALVIGQFGQHQARVSGGQLRSNDNALVGYDTLEFARKYRFDIAFMGIAAIDAEAGFMDFDDHEAELRRVLVRQATQRVILADHLKFGRQARLHTLDFAAVDTLITDGPPPETYATAFARAGLEVNHG
ncbi:MAG TPA: DeoR/GlpR family DNA-binding transcription regulator [Stellaceae bacterium]|nr:DeoR/GlpR family DNA-binding transcription regulator [Stellaceae bacterium]